MAAAHPGGTGLPRSEQPPGGRRTAMLTAALVLALAISVALAAAATAKPIYGIVPQDGALPTTNDLDLMSSAGITGLRTMLSWEQVERDKGKYDWSQADAIIRETTNRGIQPLLFLYGTPDWAANEDGRGCGTGECSAFPPRTKPTRQAFGDFAAAAAARYGPGGDFWKAPLTAPSQRFVSPPPAGDALDAPTLSVACLPSLCIPEPPPTPPPPTPTPAPLPTDPPCGCTVAHPISTWQVWNEQNSPKYFAPKVDVARYAAILHTAAAGVHSVDPQAEIVLGGMWGPQSASKVVTPTKAYLERLYALGAADDFDSIAIHPYAANAKASLAQLELARRVVSREGDSGAGTWITEVGWAGRGPSENPYVKGLAGQARVLTRALTAFKRKRASFNLRGVFWYSWRDKKGGDLICEWCGHAGLRSKSGAAKPAWTAFVRVAGS